MNNITYDDPDRLILETISKISEISSPDYKLHDTDAQSLEK